MLLRNLMASGAAGGYNAEVTTWISRATALGATPITADKNILQALSVALAAESYSSKIIWLAPFVGSTIAEHRCPLRDTRGVGAMTSLGSSAFTDADCDTTTGIVNSTEKNAYLNSLVRADQLSLSDTTSGGMGFWERNWGAGTNVEPIGCYNATGTNRFVVDLRSSLQRFRWGDPTTSQAGPGTTAGSKHYYGQCIGSTNVTQIYANGASLGSDGTSAASATNEEIYVMGCRQVAASSTPWKGRCAVAYLTDGTLSSGDVSALHTLLNTYIITATGR